MVFAMTTSSLCAGTTTLIIGYSSSGDRSTSNLLCLSQKWVAEERVKSAQKRDNQIDTKVTMMESSLIMLHRLKVMIDPIVNH